eukprot:752582-Hanusia_phi.AAC.3
MIDLAGALTLQAGLHLARCMLLIAEHMISSYHPRLTRILYQADPDGRFFCNAPAACFDLMLVAI